MMSREDALQYFHDQGMDSVLDDGADPAFYFKYEVRDRADDVRNRELVLSFEFPNVSGCPNLVITHYYHLET